MINVTDAKNDLYKVFIVEPHPIVRIGLTGLISSIGDSEVCGIADNPHNALPMIASLKPNLVITELLFYGDDGCKFIRSLRSIFPEIDVVVFSECKHYGYVEKAIRAGVRGYLVKSMPLEEIVSALRCVLNGSLYLGEELKPDHKKTMMELV